MSPSPRALPPSVAHVADFYRRYPGEIVNFYTRVRVQEPVSGYTLRIVLPAGLEPEDCAGPTRLGAGAAPRFGRSDGACDVLWSIPGGAPADTLDEYVTRVRVMPADEDQSLTSRAILALAGFAEPEEKYPGSAEESVMIAVACKARWLHYLPALYDDDSDAGYGVGSGHSGYGVGLMARFLMLFESFWTPVEGQIEDVSCYFDPRLTPVEFLPWLAEWLDLALDESWPEAKRRQLLRVAASLYRRRGTKAALLEFLEIYTGERAAITEYRAQNFRLGPAGRLGVGLALGRANVPNTFTVTLRLAPPSGAGSEETRLEAERERQIRAIIDAEKPAYAYYDLRLEQV